MSLGSCHRESEWPGPPGASFPEDCVLFAEMAFVEHGVIFHRDAIGAGAEGLGGPAHPGVLFPVLDGGIHAHPLPPEQERHRSLSQGLGPRHCRGQCWCQELSGQPHTREAGRPSLFPVPASSAPACLVPGSLRGAGQRVKRPFEGQRLPEVMHSHYRAGWDPGPREPFPAGVVLRGTASGRTAPPPLLEKPCRARGARFLGNVTKHLPSLPERGAGGQMSGRAQHLLHPDPQSGCGRVSLRGAETLPRLRPPH